MATKRAELEDLKVPELKSIAKDKGIKGYSALKKQELVDMICEAEEKEQIPFSKKPQQDITPNMAWSAIMGSMKYHSYYLAAVNLYGVIKKDEMAEILKHYTEAKLNVNQMLEEIRNNIAFAGQYCLYGDYIVSDIYRENNMQGVLEMIEVASKYKRYIPETKEEFLQYEDGMYCERTPAIVALENYVTTKYSALFANNSEAIDDFMRSVHIYCVNQTILDDYRKLCDDFGLKFQNEDEAEKLQTLVLDVYYNTRLWSKNGHTFAECEQNAHELKSNKDKTFEELKKEFQKKTDALEKEYSNKVVKVGRNDLCPCGSGLKYKKCCGKNA